MRKAFTCIVCSAVIILLAAASNTYGSNNINNDPPTVKASAEKPGAGQEIGKSADNLGDEISKSAGKIGEDAVKGSGEILRSIGKFLEGFGMESESGNTTVPTTPTQVETDEKGITPEYKNDPKDKLNLSCPRCGQKFEVLGFPKGSNYYCPSCGGKVQCPGK